jgi:hypothetical protein
MQSNRAISSMINTSRVEKPSGLNVPALKCRLTRFSNAYNSDSPADFTFSSRCKNVSVSSWICFVIVSLVGGLWFSNYLFYRNLQRLKKSIYSARLPIKE